MLSGGKSSAPTVNVKNDVWTHPSDNEWRILQAFIENILCKNGESPCRFIEKHYIYEKKILYFIKIGGNYG